MPSLIETKNGLFNVETLTPIVISDFFLFVLPSLSFFKGDSSEHAAKNNTVVINNINNFFICFPLNLIDYFFLSINTAIKITIPFTTCW